MTSLNRVNKTRKINGMTFEEYCDQPDLVRADALASGVMGEAYKHYFTKKGMFTGRTSIRHKPLNNMDMYEFAKTKYS